MYYCRLSCLAGYQSRNTAVFQGVYSVFIQEGSKQRSKKDYLKKITLVFILNNRVVGLRARRNY